MQKGTRNQKLSQQDSARCRKAHALMIFTARQMQDAERHTQSEAFTARRCKVQEKHSSSTDQQQDTSYETGLHSVTVSESHAVLRKLGLMRITRSLHSKTLQDARETQQLHRPTTGHII
jgi:hypothetical protein